jgi:putative heme-binding domain-containing protein
VYPQDTWGHAFIGNIHDNAIHEEVLTPVGSTFKCEPRRDFLRANNGWFRPVSTRTGPDGNLWVMDWCDKYPCYQNAKANPEGVDRERGRIWRVVYAGDQRSADTPVRNERLRASSESGDVRAGKSARAPVASRPTKDMDLAKLSTPELVKLLEHPNNWMRRWARRVLVERQDVEATVAAISKIPDDAAIATKMDSFWTVHGLGKADGKLLNKLVANADIGLRSWSARLTGEAWGAYLKKLGEEPLPKKWADQKMAALSLNGEQLKDALARLGRLARDRELPTRSAVAVALRQFSAGGLTVNRPSAFAMNEKYSAGHIEELIGALSADEWTEGGPPPTDVFNEKDWPPGKAFTRQAGDQLLAFEAWQAVEPVALTQGTKLAFRLLIQAHPNNAGVERVVSGIAQRLSESGNDKALSGIIKSLGVGVPNLSMYLSALVTGQQGRVTRPDNEAMEIVRRWAASTDQSDAHVRKHASNLRVLWGDPAAIQQLAATMLEAKTPEAERIAALQTLRKVRSDEARKAYASVVAQVSDLGGAGLGSQSTAASKTPANDATAPKASASGPGSLPRATTGTASAFALEVIRAASDLGNDTFPKAIASGWAHLASALRVAALDTLASRPAWTHAMLDAITANEISVTGFPATVRRQLATSKDKAIRDHAAKVLGVWKDSSDDIKALIAAKKKACLEGEPDLAQGKVLFQTTCAVCHVFHGGGQKVGPELIGSGRSNLDAILANVIDPNQIIGNGYENFIISTKDNRTLMGRVTEDAPSHVKLLAIGGAEQVVPRDQIAKLENTHQSLMPMGFGGLPDDQFRNLIWYVLAPPDEGPLTADKKKALSTSIDAAPTKPKSKWAAIDWESVSLWNPKWKVIAPEFERTPLKLAEYHGRKNVLLMHPFEDKKTPCALEHKLVIDAAHPRLKFAVAADDRGDWMVRVVVNGQAVKELPVNHEAPRWKDVVIDLSAHAGKEVTVRLEGHATGWTWEFSYWDQVRWE